MEWKLTKLHRYIWCGEHGKIHLCRWTGERWICEDDPARS